jgi:hypothetical protein
MDIQQAVQLVDAAMASLNLNREGHAKLQQAMKTIVDELGKNLKPESRPQPQVQPEPVTADAS